MDTRLEVLWLSAELESAELCTVRAGSDGAAITSTTLLPFNDRPARIEYTVLTDTAWRADSVTVQVTSSGSDQVFRLDHTDDIWVINGTARPDLNACVDVDLGWTPATNLLPLRRNPLAIGESAVTTAAWVRFPELDVVPSEQTYTRLAADRILYQSATFEAELVVTTDDLVIRYGDDLWIAAAHDHTARSAD